MKLLPKFIRHAADKTYNSYLTRKLNLFDKDWYTEQYPCAKEYPKGAFAHYIKEGYKKNYNPSSAFSTERYLIAYPDVKQWHINPLIHYIRKGRKQGRFCYSTTDMGELNDTTGNNRPLVSVVVTSYNYELLIKETLDSLEKQTYKNFEVIVVDDGSKDNSTEVIKKYIRTYDNIKLFTHEGGKNKGLVASMLLGIKNACGEYIAFCESDDYWAPDYLEKKVELINRYRDVAIISNDIQLIGDKDSVKKREKYIDDIKKLIYAGGTPVDVKYNKSMNYIPTLSAVMVRSDVLNSLDFSTPIPAWIDFWLYRQILSKHMLYFVDSKLTFWRQHNSYNDPANAEKYSKRLNEFLTASDILLDIKNDFVKTREVKEIEKSELFDAAYYTSQVKDIPDDISAAMHYYYIGWRIGAEPSESFSGKAYLAMYPDLSNADVCPLAHYITAGRRENRTMLSVKETEELSINQNDIEEIKNLHDNKETILLITHELSLTGAPRALANMAYELKKEGKIPVVISNKYGPLMKEIEERGILCKVDYSLNAPNSYTGSEHTRLTEYACHFDFIVFNTIISIPLIHKFTDSKAMKICWIHEGRIGYHYCPHSEQLKETLKLYDKVFVVGEYCKKITSQYCSDETSLESLLYYIDDISNAQQNSYSNDSDKIKMVLAGTIEKRKGQEILLDSMRFIHKDIRNKIEIAIVGSNVEQHIYDKLRKSKYDCIKLYGSVPHEKLLDMMNKMDILLCPSIDDPMPIVCTEAFMLSKPVIVGINTGTAALITNGENGFVVKDEKPQSLADTIITAYQSRSRYVEIGRKGRKIYENYFSHDSFQKRIKEIF